jgi:hypothetical protein
VVRPFLSDAHVGGDRRAVGALIARSFPPTTAAYPQGVKPDDLETNDGRAWLESHDGVEWLRTPDGSNWLESRAGRLWMDDLAQHGFADYFAGRLPPPPAWAMTPETAPRIGTRVRLLEAMSTPSAHFKAGELMIVSELRLAPIGAVAVTLRDINGHRLLTFSTDGFVPA